MTMLPLHGTLTSAAGVPLTQTAGSETERNQKEAISQRRSTDANQHAEQSAGIGQTEEDERTTERDADGRRLWERPGDNGKKPENQPRDVVGDPDALSRQSKDPTGQSGTKLDLTG